MGFKIPYSSDEIDAACIQACEKNNIIDGYVRPIAWRGSEMMGVSAQDTQIHLAIAVWAWPSYFPALLSSPGHLAGDRNKIINCNYLK